MHFLCLHGMGTNSQVFEMQTAKFRFELGGHHTYEFVEGEVRHPPAPGLGVLYPASESDEFFEYADGSSPASCKQALVDLEAYIEAEGPFEGVMAFSQGASLAATMIALKILQDPMKEHAEPLFKCAIFFSAVPPIDPAALLQKDEIQVIDPAVHGEYIQIPTAHIWGTNDEDPTYGVLLSKLCSAKTRSIVTHDGAHEVPGSKMPEAVTAAVRIAKKVIDMATLR